MQMQLKDRVVRKVIMAAAMLLMMSGEAVAQVRVNGSVYGGCNTKGTIGGNTVVNLTSGIVGTATTGGDVFGGGYGQQTGVDGNVTVRIGKTTVNGDVYGGSALGNVNTGTTNTTTVSLTKGEVKGNVYGGGLGQKASDAVEADEEKGIEARDKVEGIAALVNGNVTVELNRDVSDDEKGCIVGGSIFGCNNLNGTPLGTVTVHVYKTQNAEASQIVNSGETTDAKQSGRYDLAAVYGGGNLSAYVPTDLANGTTHVIIDGCDRTSIRQVYGGGNAASAPATKVEVYGTFEVEEVFGGGNGKDDIVVNGVQKSNPGANVGYYEYPDDADFDTRNDKNSDSDTKYTYGSGLASTNIYGGTIHSIFGGSNTKGNIREVALAMLDNQNDDCGFIVDEAYGGGKSAPMDGVARLELKCIPGLGAIYGGAEHADVNNDVVMTVTNGEYGRVFGGNNLGGAISGTITVNIEETGCKPIVIGQLYGGGNRASYTAPEGKSGPTVNVYSFTSIGEIYGGGYGETAVVTGDTYVNINEVILDTEHAKKDFAGKTITIREADAEEDDPGEEVVLPARPVSEGKSAMGVIGKVYGGGNAAMVDGNTHVNIGTEATVDLNSLTTDADVKGADIRGNVYGGGNAANVTGKTYVTIGQQKTVE